MFITKRAWDFSEVRVACIDKTPRTPKRRREGSGVHTKGGKRKDFNMRRPFVEFMENVRNCELPAGK